jgi:hypothetical protein
MLKSYIFSIAFVSLVSCEKSDDLSEARRNSKVTAAEIESMVVLSGQEYVTTVGSQQASGPYQNWGSSGGDFGWTIRFENLTFSAPNDGREYIARRFRNPDGTAFMKISKHPEGTNKPKRGESAEDTDTE